MVVTSFRYYCNGPPTRRDFDTAAFLRIGRAGKVGEAPSKDLSHSVPLPELRRLVARDRNGGRWCVAEDDPTASLRSRSRWPFQPAPGHWPPMSRFVTQTMIKRMNGTERDSGCRC